MAWPVLGISLDFRKAGGGVSFQGPPTLSTGDGWRRDGDVQLLTLPKLGVGFPFFISHLALASHPL